MNTIENQLIGQYIINILNKIKEHLKIIYLFQCKNSNIRNLYSYNKC